MRVFHKVPVKHCPRLKQPQQRPSQLPLGPHLGQQESPTMLIYVHVREDSCAPVFWHHLFCTHLVQTSQERKFSPKRKFWAGHPCGRPAKNFGQALQILEKQAFRNGHPTRTSMKKLRSEKLRADLSFPNQGMIGTRFCHKTTRNSRCKGIKICWQRPTETHSRKTTQ